MMFDDTPVMHLTTQNLDIDLDLQIAELYLVNTTLEDVELGFQLSKQFMQFKPFTLKGERGGRFEGEFSLDGRGATPRMRLTLGGKDIRLGLAATPGQDLSTYPPLDLEMAMDGAGDNPARNGRFTQWETPRLCRRRAVRQGWHGPALYRFHHRVN